ncbi:hypothetical protein PR003_g26490 [Phytophthora rubi]|uniref:RxLR effector protein n=1 Tax=Phytophthora rubi TaxID=129364 RepID=A0A6A3GF02_9STRA|nr:hypothetical protein PR001_g31523 [Phytophthora rubi]KAE8975361.1 hypothetical protein PR002_g25622 [Phytophthora rubi]KAE9285780.1 hypothetical protein PR003_g26490 [Phytophthora rubi]
MRLTQVAQVVLVVLIALFASYDAAAATTKNKITPSTANSFVAGFRSLLALGDASTDLLASDEERVSNAATAAAEGGRAGAGATGTVSSATTGGGGTITVTKYWNNGLLQKLERWWKKLLHRKTESKSPSRRLRAPK